MTWLGPLLQSLSQGFSEGVGQGYILIGRLNWGRICFQDRSVTSLQGFDSLKNCWAEGLSSSLVDGWKVPSVPCHMDLFISQLALLEQARKKSQRVSVFYNLVSEVISHHSCHILFIRSKSVGPALKQGVEVTQGHEYQEAGIIGSHFRSCIPHHVNCFSQWENRKHA